mmetsp:Transcript_2352/g.4091  ORF Transcript_2352/g.4091 Transcript_2352/m.4091 type:complete len:355 (-) Transcript_2352:95-1159(-)
MTCSERLRSVDWRAVAAEFFATTMFVWAGCGVAVTCQQWGSDLTLSASELIAISLGFGLAISTLAYGIGHISGGHINPAVTFSFMWMNTMDRITCWFYILAQFVGAWFGALLLWGTTASLVFNCNDESTSNVCLASRQPDGSYGPPFGLGANQVGADVTQWCAFIGEAIGTYVLVFTVLHSAVHTKSTARNAAPIAIGWAVLLAHLVLVPLTGCGINPARTFGPLVVNSMAGVNKWTRGWWVYYTAPFVGSWFATLTYQFIFRIELEDGDGLRVTDDEVEDLILTRAQRARKVVRALSRGVSKKLSSLKVDTRMGDKTEESVVSPANTVSVAIDEELAHPDKTIPEDDQFVHEG